jgi:hypothetical protein
VLVRAQRLDAKPLAEVDAGASKQCSGVGIETMMFCCCAATEVNIKFHAQRRVRDCRPSNTTSSNNTSRLLSASWRLARDTMKRSFQSR